MIEEFQHRDWAGIPHETFCHCVVIYLVIHFTRTFELLIEQFQDRDWIGILHETFIIVSFYVLVIHFTRPLAFQGHQYFKCVRLALVLFVRYY